MADLDDPVLAALAADRDLPLPQVDVTAPRVAGSYRRSASSDSRMPVAVNTAMIAVSRRWAKLRRAQACSSRASSSSAKTDQLAGDVRRRQPGHRAGTLASAASHLKNVVPRDLGVTARLIAVIDDSVVLAGPDLTSWPSRCSATTSWSCSRSPGYPGSGWSSIPPTARRGR